MSHDSHADDFPRILSPTASAIIMTLMILPYCAPEAVQMGKKFISNMVPQTAKRLSYAVAREVAWLKTAPRR